MNYQQREALTTNMYKRKPDTQLHISTKFIYTELNKRINKNTFNLCRISDVTKVKVVLLSQ